MTQTQEDPYSSSHFKKDIPMPVRNAMDLSYRSEGICCLRLHSLGPYPFTHSHLPATPPEPLAVASHSRTGIWHLLSDYSQALIGKSSSHERIAKTDLMVYH